jgi:hypothetical protein
MKLLEMAKYGQPLLSWAKGARKLLFDAATDRDLVVDKGKIKRAFAKELMREENIDLLEDVIAVWFQNNLQSLIVLSTPKPDTTVSKPQQIPPTNVAATPSKNEIKEQINEKVAPQIEKIKKAIAFVATLPMINGKEFKDCTAGEIREHCRALSYVVEGMADTIVVGMELSAEQIQQKVETCLQDH